MTTRLFYAIICDDQFVRHVSREHSSSHTESIILDVAPCSATFVNNFIDALNVHTDLYAWAENWALNSVQGKEIEFFINGSIVVKNYSENTIYISGDNGIIELLIIRKQI